MGIYSGSNIFSNNSTYIETLDSIYNDVDVKPVESDNIEEESLYIVENIHENYQTIMKHIGIAELQSLEESGREMVYTEGVLSSMFNAVKNFLQKIWEKIKSLFKRFMMIIDSYTKTDKEFLDKYRSQILAARDLSNFTFKGYKWNENAFNQTPSAMLELTAASAGSGATAHLSTGSSEEYDKLEDKYDDFEETIRGEVIKGLGGQGGKFTSSEFIKELKEIYQSGDSEKQELDNKDIKVHDIITELAESRKLKKGVNDVFKACKKSVEDDEKYVERMQKDHFKSGVPGDEKKQVSDVGKPQGKDTYDTYAKLKTGASKDSAAASRLAYIDRIVDKFQSNGKVKDIEYDGNKYKDLDELKNVLANAEAHKTYGTTSERDMSERTTKNLNLQLRMIKTFKDILIQINSSYLSAWKTRSRQNKAIAIKIVAYKPKKEEYYNESYIGESFLSNIELK